MAYRYRERIETELLSDPLSVGAQGRGK